MVALIKYSPDQPRNEQGEWTDTGGGGGTATTALRVETLMPHPPGEGWRDERIAYVIDASGRGVSQRGAAHPELYHPLIVAGGSTALRMDIGVVDRGWKADIGTTMDMYGSTQQLGPAAAAFLDRYRPAGPVTIHSGPELLTRHTFEGWQDAELWFKTHGHARPSKPLNPDKYKSLIKYDPNQPRNEQGEWTDTGGGLSIKTLPKINHPTEAVAIGRMAAVVNNRGEGLAQYGGTHPDLFDRLGDTHAETPSIRLGIPSADAGFSPYITFIKSTPATMGRIAAATLEHFKPPGAVNLEWSTPTREGYGHRADVGFDQTRDFDSWQEAALWLKTKQPAERPSKPLNPDKYKALQPAWLTAIPA